MTTTETYQILDHNYTRQAGDQWRVKPFRTGRNVNEGDLNNPPWQDVRPSMFGHKILQSDLIHLEFRRPV